jgi:hypothetical protein
MDDKREFVGKEINENISNFPEGILETMKPIYMAEVRKPQDGSWNRHVLYVYQDGTYQWKILPQKLPFNWIN